jgi:hypothetical protein
MDTKKNDLKRKMEKTRNEYKTMGSKSSMFKLLYFQRSLELLNEQNQETNFKIKEICK